MNETTRQFLAVTLFLAVVAIAFQPQARADCPPQCDPELGCIEVR
jgi:hypothetical protein